MAKSAEQNIPLSQDQQKKLDLARKELNDSVGQCKKTIFLDEQSTIIRRARKGIEALSFTEASWLNQKKWTPVEKTYILCHVDEQRNKRERSVSLYDIGVTAGLALTATAAQFRDCRTLSAILTFITIAKALTVAIDYTKDRVINQLIRNGIEDVSLTNENVRTGIHYLTPNETYLR